MPVVSNKVSCDNQSFSLKAVNYRKYFCVWVALTAFSVGNEKSFTEKMIYSDFLAGVLHMLECFVAHFVLLTA